MDIQYFHHNIQAVYKQRKKYTIALEVPTKEEIMIYRYLFMNPDHSVKFKIGKARVHKNDLYNKDTGRVVSRSKMIEKEFKLVSIEKSYSYENDFRFLFEDTQSKETIDLMVNLNRDRVYFVKHRE